jgi:hypothetical protein
MMVQVQMEVHCYLIISMEVNVALIVCCEYQFVYMNNIMHDVWYQYGFNEANGNFQENNYQKVD